MNRTKSTFGAALGALALHASACAISEDPPGNGQSHWLQSCDDDSDCGDLSCECGVCTIQCTNDDACTAFSGITCRSASTLASSECSGEADALMLCLNEELAPLPDRAMPEPADAETLDTGLSDDAAVETVDASRDDAADSSPTNPDALHITCDAIAAEELSTGIELVGSGFEQNIENLTASDDAVAWSGVGGARYRLGSGPLDIAADVAGVPVLDGSELFFAQDGDVSKLLLDTGESVAIGPDPTFSGQAVTPSDDGVYWVTTDPTNGIRGQVWRSDREAGGDTEAIGAYEGESPFTLAVLGDFVYFIRYPSDGGKVVSRARRDGSANVQDLTEPIEPIEHLGNMISDGTSLFATIAPPVTSDGPSPGPHLVVRIEADGSVTTLFETFRIWWHFMFTNMIVDDAHLYWIARSSEGTPREQSLWRGRKDGQGEPIQIASGLPEDDIQIAGNSSSIYFRIDCPDAASVVRIDKPN